MLGGGYFLAHPVDFPSRVSKKKKEEKFINHNNAIYTS